MTRKGKFGEIFLGITYDKLYEKNKGHALTRKDAYRVFGQSIRIDKAMARMILTELQDMGLIENQRNKIIMKKDN